jgi:CRISPR/Cas system-associated exonuclease Cas4 (RecB family)
LTTQLAEIPDGIVRYLKRDVNRSYARRCNHYWVTDICRCLRQSYYQISGTKVDPTSNSDSLVGSLWAMKSGKLLHGLTYAYSWRELEIEKKIMLSDIEEELTLHGRLDMYDHRSETLIELKTTASLRWQYNSGMIPRRSDIDQIRCYGTIFGQSIRISKLLLLYADQKEMIPIRVTEEDKSNWILDRLERLHTSIMITKLLPPAEISDACKFCRFSERCKADNNS